MHVTHHEGPLCPQPATGPDLTAVAAQFNLWATGTPIGITGPAASGYRVTEAGLAALDEAPAEEAPGTAARVLRSAATYLERHGWTQHAYFDPTATIFTPAADMAGAIGMVCYGGPVEAPAQHFDDPGFLDWEEAVLHLDRYLLVHDGSECYEFNDAPGRRIEDVLRVLREAASTPAYELVDALRAASLAEQRLTALLGGER